jgi:hypothetical protein
MIDPGLHVVVGVIKIRQHCLFTWREPANRPGSRRIEIGPEHCEECVAELERIIQRPVYLVDTRPPTP